MPIKEFLQARNGGVGWRRWSFAAASVVVHAILIAALVVATREDRVASASPAPDEEVTYVDIASVPPPPPPPAAAQPRPQPRQTQPRQARPQPRQPRPEPRAQTPARPTDIPVPELDSLPEPLGAVAPPEPVPGPVSAAPIDPGAVTGSAGGQPGGQAGGQAGGTPGGTPGGQAVDPGGTYVAAVVDRKAELRNRRELPRIMERLYPALLRDAGIGGRVVVQFVVQPNGRVDMSSVKVLSSTHDGLTGPTRKALEEFRFTPAQMGSRKVRMLTQMPIVWQVAN